MTTSFWGGVTGFGPPGTGNSNGAMVPVGFTQVGSRQVPNWIVFVLVIAIAFGVYKLVRK